MTYMFILKCALKLVLKNILTFTCLSVGEKKREGPRGIPMFGQDSDNKLDFTERTCQVVGWIQLHWERLQ